jgi:hypothetical protein
MSAPGELAGSVFRILHLPDRDDGRGAAFFFDDDTIAWLGRVAEIHVVAIAPGRVRGNHRHAARREVVFVHHQGAVEVAWRGPGRDDTEHVTFEGAGGFIARIEPGTLHALRNAGTGFVEVVSLSNGRFDPSETDYVTLLTAHAPDAERQP